MGRGWKCFTWWYLSGNSCIQFLCVNWKAFWMTQEIRFCSCSLLELHTYLRVVHMSRYKKYRGNRFFVTFSAMHVSWIMGHRVFIADVKKKIVLRIQSRWNQSDRRFKMKKMDFYFDVVKSYIQVIFINTNPQHTESAQWVITLFKPISIHWPTLNYWDDENESTLLFFIRHITTLLWSRSNNLNLCQDSRQKKSFYFDKVGLPLNSLVSCNNSNW